MAGDALTPRLELIDRLTHEEQDSQEQIDAASVRGWLNEVRHLRAELPLTSDSLLILSELREVRSRQ
ncbi:MAG TPA: hypothetical protein VFR78_09950 [Pyrinomonadaceae bacterium]|nr:hypothetical protein [Pyrinomonadaceae bacterium]